MRLPTYVLLSLLFFSFLFLGCAGSPARLSTMTPNELRTQNSFDLCNTYRFFGGHARIKAELERRNEIPPNEWRLIENRQIQIGMSGLSLVCSWGHPGGGYGKGQ